MTTSSDEIIEQLRVRIRQLEAENTQLRRTSVVRAPVLVDMGGIPIPEVFMYGGMK